MRAFLAGAAGTAVSVLLLFLLGEALPVFLIVLIYVALGIATVIRWQPWWQVWLGQQMTVLLVLGREYFGAGDRDVGDIVLAVGGGILLLHALFTGIVGGLGAVVRNTLAEGDSR